MKIKFKKEPNGSSPILKGLDKWTLHTLSALIESATQ